MSTWQWIFALWFILSLPIGWMVGKAIEARLEAWTARMGHPCRHGCDMRHAGGRNAGCDIGDDCCCSVPVYACTRCGDSDYGNNEEAAEVRRRCAIGGYDIG